ncbi:hypothetical protein D9M71_673290 [compost metagenome]
MTQPDSGLARNSAAPAMSVGWPKRPSGIQFGNCTRCSAAIICDMGNCGVSVDSGAIWLTRMPTGPNSSARLLVKPPMAALKAA